MTYHQEHKRMQPVLAKAQALDIATNPAPEAIFADKQGGFQIWCTPDDHPPGWENVPMGEGSFPKACAYVGIVLWGWEEGRITHLLLSTEAFFLGEHDRPDDLRWAKKKIRRLFQLADVPLLPIRTFE